MAEEQRPPNLLHNPHSPDVFADAASGVFLFNGNMRVTFESYRADHGGSEPQRVVIGRLVMPWAAAEAMAKLVLDQIEKTKAELSAPRSTTVQ